MTSLTSKNTVYFQSKNHLLRVKSYEPNMVDRSLSNELRPFIFSNSLNLWLALKLWNPMFFKKKYGKEQFMVTLNLPDKICPYFYNAKLYRTLMKFSDFIDLLSENKNCYLAQEDMSAFKDLTNDYNFCELIPTIYHSYKVSTNLWIGSNTRSGLHLDNYDNFLAQIYGIKKVVLIPPEDAEFLYPIPSNFFKSPLNPMEPDLCEFPKFKNARVFEGELRPGDVLFIPKGWYHYIYSPGQSISLNSWYGPSLTLKQLLLSFFNSGWRCWLITLKDFVWYGVLSRPFETKLYSSPPIGKVAYDLVKAKTQQLYIKLKN